MPRRHANSPDYRYGFNGKEKDDEVKGVIGSSYTTEFRQYDSRLGRWLSLDPLMAKYPHQSPYAAFNNNPIYFKDPTGLEGDPPTESNDIGAPDIDVKKVGGNTRHIRKELAKEAFKKPQNDPSYGFIKDGDGFEKIGFQKDGEQGSVKGSFFAVKLKNKCQKDKLYKV
jgi:RHS repeat-associated protein